MEISIISNPSIEAKGELSLNRLNHGRQHRMSGRKLQVGTSMGSGIDLSVARKSHHLVLRVRYPGDDVVLFIT